MMAAVPTRKTVGWIGPTSASSVAEVSTIGSNEAAATHAIAPSALDADVRQRCDFVARSTPSSLPAELSVASDNVFGTESAASADSSVLVPSFEPSLNRSSTVVSET